MTLTLDISAELESQLSAQAARLGVSLPEHALNVLRGVRSMPSSPQTGAELVDYWRREGLLGSRADILDSQEHARQIRKAAETRSRG